MALGSSDGRVTIDTALDNRGFIKGIRGMTGQVDGLRGAVQRLGTAITAAFAVKAVVDFGKQAVRIGSDVAEVQNVVDVAFGELSGQAEEFARTSITQFGMSALSAKKTASTYMAMAKGMGVAGQESADMAVTLAGLSGDVASFFNISQELADIKLRSVFTGETETLKDLGVVMTQDNLKAYALSKGFKKSYESMSQAEKVALRYRFVLDSLALANGDFARTQDSWANQTRILSMQWQEFMGILGQSIITVLKPVVKWLNAVVSHMIALATMLNNTVSKAFGGEGKQAEQAEATSTAISSSVDNQEALTDAVKDTNKAQQRSLAGFDEITQLAGEAAESAGGIGGGGEIDVGGIAIPDLSDLPEEEPGFTSWGEAFSAFLDTVLAGIPSLKAAFGDFASWLNGFSKKLYDMLTFPGVLEKVQQLGRDLADAFNHLVAQINWYQLGQALGAGLNLALQFLVSFLYSFNWIALGGQLASLVNGLVSEIDWYAFGMLLFKGFKIALEILAGFLLGLDMPQLARAASQTVIGFFNAMQETIAGIDWWQIGAQIALFLNNIDWAGAIAAFVRAAKELVLAFLQAVGGFIANADPEVLIAAAGLLAAVVVKRIVGTVVAPLAKELVDNVIKKIAEAMTSSGFASILGTIGKTIAGIGAIIGGVVLAASSFFSMWNEGFSWAKEAVMLLGIALTAVGAIILGAPAVVAGVIAGIVAAVATAVIVIKEHWKEIQAAFSSLLEHIRQVVDSIKEKLQEWFDKTKEGWETYIKPVLENVIAKFKEVIEENIKPLIEQAVKLIENIQKVVKALWDSVLAPFLNWLTETMWRGVASTLENMANVVMTTIETISGIITGLLEVLNGVIDFLTGVFIGDWEKVFSGIKEIVSSAIKIVSGVISGFINLVKNAIDALLDFIGLSDKASNAKVPAQNTSSRGGGFSSRTVYSRMAATPESYSAVALPRLARGAVIPPNREFMAVLGDQRSGNNLEAPEGLIRRIVREESRGSDYSALLQAILEAIQDGHIIMVDRRVLGQTVTQEQNRMTRQAGRSVLLG